MMGAEYSIYVRGSSDLLRRSGLTEGHLFAVDSRLDLRCLLCQSSFEPRDDPFIGLDVFAIDEPFPDPAQADSRDWAMRRRSENADRIDVVIDDSIWFALEVDSTSKVTGGMVHRDARGAAQHFRREWEEADQIDLLYLEADDDFSDDDDSSIVVDPSSYFDRLSIDLQTRPEQLQEMSDRKFEEFVAEMLNRDGFEVHLTPQTRDGGFDVLAMRRLEALGELLFLVECKRYKRSRKVGVEIVRSLYGVVCEKRANAGLVVTTSTFSKPAIEKTREIGAQMALKDYNGILEWMKRLRG